MRLAVVTPAIALLLGACATTAEEPPVRELPGECNAASVQDRVGQRATSELGGTLLRLTGAQVLRWVPPRTAVTMDFRPDRLTVSYDDNMVIERISCG
jgi:Peptidase inhibitor I78 family